MAQRRMKGRVATILYLRLELHWKPEDLDAMTRLRQLVETMEQVSAFHAQSLKMSLEWIDRCTRLGTFVVFGAGIDSVWDGG